ncbi:hypothetical protein NZK32_16595 [Cyanobium sp. FGCU-52]|nr:hypothetical protein [Cyanobium sp. FGCU52]
MNLIEPLVASLVFCGVASASLQIWALGLEAGQTQQQLQSLHDRIDGELIASESRLRQLPRPSAPPPCSQLVPQLVASLEMGAPAEGLQRQVEASADGQALLVRVVGPTEDASRVRLLHPAALGLCGAEGGHGPS